MQPTSRALEIAGPVRDLLVASDSLYMSAPSFDPATSDRVFKLLLTDVGMIVFLPPLMSRTARAGSKLSQRGKVNTALTAMEGQRQARKGLVDERHKAAATWAALQIERATIDGERRVIEADPGPVRYLATLLGAGDQDVMRWFILVVALLLDPAAVQLLLAASR